MAESTQIANLIAQIQRLDYQARMELLEHLVKLLSRNAVTAEKKEHCLTELGQLGTEAWKDVDIDLYIQQERQWD